MGAAEIIDLIELAVALLDKLSKAWAAQGLNDADFRSAVTAANAKLLEQAKLDADVELAGAGGAGA